MSARTFGNNKSDYVWIRMITFIYRSCLRDGCYTTEHKSKQGQVVIACQCYVIGVRQYRIESVSFNLGPLWQIWQILTSGKPSNSTGNFWWAHGTICRNLLTMDLTWNSRSFLDQPRRLIWEISKIKTHIISHRKEIRWCKMVFCLRSSAIHIAKCHK